MANEKRLIDANALDRVLEDFENRYRKSCFALSAKAISNARQIVYAMKTVDAMEVVRCKGCKWYAPNNGGSWLGCAFDTRHPDDVPKAEDFCSYGERKDGDGDD